MIRGEFQGAYGLGTEKCLTFHKIRTLISDKNFVFSIFTRAELGLSTINKLADSLALSFVIELLCPENIKQIGL